MDDMATISYRKHRLNASGEYDTIYTETSSEIVMRPNGSSVESAIQSLADSKVPNSRTIAGKALSDNITRTDLMFLGTNVLDADNDTTAKWTELGPGYAFYSDAVTLTDKPSGYGFLLNFVYGSDVFQIWSCQNAGPCYTRQGNAKGWGRTWTKIADGSLFTGTFRFESADGDKLAPNGDDNFLVTIDNGVDSTTQSGLSVRTRWGSVDSVIFEACRGWNDAGNGYFPAFRVDGYGRARAISENVNKSVDDSYFRNIKGASSDPGAGSSLATGDIVLVYE